MGGRNRVFKKTGGLRPPKSMHNLSRVRKFDCDMGKLIPIYHRLCIPGDVWNLSVFNLVRFQPLISPIMHEVDIYTHYFFVPLRILWDDWEDFISGGEDGNFKVTQPKLQYGNHAQNFRHTLLDYFCLPLKDDGTYEWQGVQPNDYFIRAYNLIWNRRYRDQDLQPERNVEPPWSANDLDVAWRAWEKDYFSSARPSRVKGGDSNLPSLPIYGTSKADFGTSELSHAVNRFGLFDFAGNVLPGMNSSTDLAYYSQSPNSWSNASLPWPGEATYSDSNRFGFVSYPPSTPGVGKVVGHGNVNIFNQNVVDLSSASSFYIDSLREVVQIQKWLERNQRAGTRYTEFLRAHFGVSPRDDRLDEPEYIGGTYQPMLINEVLNTAAGSLNPGHQTLRPQGDMAGHGISANSMRIGRYHCEEFGIIMGLLSIRPKPSYQQGIEREWLYDSNLEYPFPEFCHLGEQQVKNVEIFKRNSMTLDNGTWGYQGMYDELRSTYDQVCGNLRHNLDHWHLGRQFPSFPPLNGDFVSMNDIRKDAFASISEPSCVVSAGTRAMVLRPIPSIAVPGLMDHF